MWFNSIQRAKPYQPLTYEQENLSLTGCKKGAGAFRSETTLAGDDGVELAAEKYSAFRRAARWCGGDDVKSVWPLWAGPHTCYNGNYNGKQGCKAERIRKDCLSSDCSLQLGNMKLELLVIADQHAAVNMYPGPVDTPPSHSGKWFLPKHRTNDHP
ncbi:hypothetical protein SAY87_029728 [Trapa incisa]|uniref:Uncharacterized protein n=1 Tax=Trapa incisa TaxID=236973 RepID=A0AAN7K869_9MYRT|nr:hypothetical protein SAY87_029728 [Trapa incisa]